MAGFWGCPIPAPKVWPENALINQILRVRSGHPSSLTNGRCVSYKQNEKTKHWECEDFRINTHSLADQAVRERLNELGFICSIGKKRFKVCMDKPGFCRFKTKSTWLGLKKELILEEYIDAAERHQYLLDAATKCVSSKILKEGAPQQ